MAGGKSVVLAASMIILSAACMALSLPNAAFAQTCINYINPSNGAQVCKNADTTVSVCVSGVDQAGGQGSPICGIRIDELDQSVPMQSVDGGHECGIDYPIWTQGAAPENQDYGERLQLASETMLLEGTVNLVEGHHTITVFCTGNAFMGTGEENANPEKISFECQSTKTIDVNAILECGDTGGPVVPPQNTSPPLISGLDYSPKSAGHPTPNDDITISATATEPQTSVAGCYLDLYSYSDRNYTDYIFMSPMGGDRYEKNVGKVGAGLHYFTVVCTNNNGYSASMQSSDFPVYGTDTTGPQITSIGVSTPRTKSDAITISATASDSETAITICRLSVEGPDSGFHDMAATSGEYGAGHEVSVSWVIPANTFQVAGSQTAYIRCYNSDARQTQVSTQFDVYSASTPGAPSNPAPVVKNIGHSPASLTPQTAITITATATSKSSINVCKYSIDSTSQFNNNMVIVAKNVNNGIYTYPLSKDIGMLPAGSHNIYIKCTNADGRTNSPASYSFTVSSTPATTPVVSNIDHSPDSPTTSEQITITATATGVGITGCELKLDGGSYSGEGITLAGLPADTSKQLTKVLGAKATAGSHKVYIKCTNGAWGDATSYTFGVFGADTTPPDITKFSYSPSSPKAKTDRITLTVDVEEDSGADGSDISGCEYELDGDGNINGMGAITPAAKNNLRSGSASKDIEPIVNPGTHSVQIRCSNADGRTSQPSTYSFDVLPAPPPDVPHSAPGFEPAVFMVVLASMFSALLFGKSVYGR